jgi:hypothetical protein
VSQLHAALVALALLSTAPQQHVRKPPPPPGSAPLAPQAPTPAPQKSTQPVVPVPQKPGAPNAADPKAQQRGLVNSVVNYERVHRDRVMRLERLRALFEQQKAADKLAEVARLRALEQKLYDDVMAGYASRLGPEVYQQLRAALDEKAGTPPPAPPPPTAEQRAQQSDREMNERRPR